MRALGFVSAWVLFACAMTPSAAQAYTQSRGLEVARLTVEQQIARFENEERRRLLDPTPMNGEALYGVDRMNLARRVVDLMDARDCVAARDLAIEAGEKLMAQRVRRWCRSAEYRERGRRSIARG